MHYAPTTEMTREEYWREMAECGFAEHEIEECWTSPNRFRILDAALADGERDLGV